MDLLDRFDLILDEATRQAEESVKSGESEEVTKCVFLCPKLEDPKASWCSLTGNEMLTGLILACSSKTK